MKSYSKDEIEGTRVYFESMEFPQIPVEFGTRKFSYFLLPQSLEPNLEGFVFRCTGAPEDGAVFGIADTVKEEHRAYAVAHEFIEFTETARTMLKRKCLASLLCELSLVPPRIHQEYVVARAGFFERLIKYCEKQPLKYTPEDLNEFASSLAALRKLQQ